MIEFRLSGGASNTNPAASVGGPMSSSGFSGELPTWASSQIPGISLLSSAGNLVDDGLGPLSARLLCRPEANGWTLVFAPYGRSTSERSPDNSNARPIYADGAYALSWSGRRLSVDVVVSSLPVVEASAPIAISRSSGTLFSETDADAADAGEVDYRCVYALNAGASARSLEIGVERQPSSAKLELALDPAGPGGLAGGSGAALSYAPAVYVTLEAGQAAALWIRREVALLNQSALSADEAAIYAEEVLP